MNTNSLILLLASLLLMFAAPADATAAHPYRPAEGPTIPPPDKDGWVRPSAPGDPLIWGRHDGFVFGLRSDGGLGGPRGLIRVAALDPVGIPEIINFIAIEPVTKGTGPRHTRLALSELEPSQLDPGKRGKRLWTTNPAGELVTSGTTQWLRVRIEVEPFSANRAHVYLIASIQRDRPDEIQFEVHHHHDSAPIEELTLTATMGNKERLRYLWLKDKIVDSRELYAGYDDFHFVEKHPYPKKEMLTWNGDPIAISTTNEADPGSVIVERRPSWNYPVDWRLTQYWRVPRKHVQDNLRIRVNARQVYWNGEIPIPGGLSFENFEVQQTYVPGQVSIFGMTRNEPHDFRPPVKSLPKAPELE